MKGLIALLLFGASSVAFANIDIDSTRMTAYDYACVDGAGAVLSSHQRFDKAFSACAVRAADDPDGEYDVQGGRWRVVVTNNVDLRVIKGCLPSFEGAWSNQNFDVSLCVEGSDSYTVAVDDPSWSVNGTVLTAPTSGSGVVKISIISADMTFVFDEAWSIL